MMGEDNKPDEYTRKCLDSLTDDEKYKMILNSYRDMRNIDLRESDLYMPQTDRFTTEQIDMLKQYRQDLRDFINLNHENMKKSLPIEYPKKPDFIK